jgi:uncharacterized membrane protein YhaH (DUF805 family)
MIDAFTSAWQRSFDYEGRSSRPDYWWFVLANNILFLVLFVLGLSLPALAPGWPSSTGLPRSFPPCR